MAAVAHAQPGNVAVFNNPQFIDNDNTEAPGVFEAEGPNTIASLQSFGENVTAFTDFSAAGFSAALAGKDSLVIPEEEPQEQEITLRGEQSDCLDAFMDDDARAVISNFVNAGGQLVVLAIGEDGCNATLVNHIFPNLQLVTSDDDSESLVTRGKVGPVIFNKTAEANGTEWQDGPASIPENNATGTVNENSLHAAGGRSIYSDGAGNAAVSDIPFGDGSISLLGYDWFNSSPPNPVLATSPTEDLRDRGQARGIEEPGQDFGWQDVLRRSVDLPLLNVNDVSQNEGNSGNTPFNFTVSTSQNHSENVKASFATADGSAKAGSDYTAGSGAVTVARFTASSPLTVNVTGDKAIEPNETFAVNLAGAYPAVVGKAGAGTIVNDDFAAPKVSVAGVRTACISKAIRVRFSINSTNALKSVRVTLDGKRVASTTKKRFTIGVNGKKLSAGRHRLVVVATDTAGKKTTLRRTISVCAAAKPRHQTGPRFTG